MSLGEYLDVIILGVDSLLALAFYKAYKSVQKEADLIERSPLYKIGDELNDAINKSPEKCLPYVTIVGNVKALEEPLNGIQTNSQGVFRCNEVFEHKSIRSSIGWQNVSNKLQSFTDFRRFAIVDTDSVKTEKVMDCVEVVQPLDSTFLIDSLPIVFSSYEPLNGNVLSRGLDILIGNVVQGHHLTERILKENSTLLAVGRVYAVTSPIPKVITRADLCLNPGLHIGPPVDNNQPFVLSLMNKNQIVCSIRQRSNIYRFTFCTFGVIGVGILTYIIYKIYMKWKTIKNKKNTSEMGINPSYSINSPAYTGESPCVVCLTAAKDSVLLPCRHMCVCSTCYESIISPKKCPVCRSEVKEKLSVYVP